MTIQELMHEAHETAVGKGWYGTSGTEHRNFGEVLALMHSELSEALEEYRKGAKMGNIYYSGPDDKPEGIAVELADLLIRMADTCEHEGIPLVRALKEKLAFNRTRSYRHGNKRA